MANFPTLKSSISMDVFRFSLDRFKNPEARKVSIYDQDAILSFDTSNSSMAGSGSCVLSGNQIRHIGDYTAFPPSNDMVAISNVPQDVLSIACSLMESVGPPTYSYRPFVSCYLDSNEKVFCSRLVGQRLEVVPEDLRGEIRRKPP